ncbi:dihydrolipoyl dehydrogenase [Erythrobacter sp. R86502]|uniref:dihydrolipoyl dehydrogenase n=1 Tax=Erythrobacter sp. R86502 TaxID=3093846 RepID=UPI0036D3C39D
MSAPIELLCDVAIIGAGTAGLAAERAARANGAKTLLIDPNFDGTTCANVGCMPSKLLIAAAKARRSVDRAQVFGVNVGDVSVDGESVMQRVQDERDRFAALTRKSIREIPDGIRIEARAKFSGRCTLDLDDGRSITAKTIVIATGSRPAMPDAFAKLGDRALTNRTIFELATLPRRLAVVGAGAIGLEMAQAFAGLGVAVALFDKSETMAKVRCPRVHDALEAIISDELEVHLGVDVTPERRGDEVCLRWEGKSVGEAMFDYVIVAVGRPPVLDGIAIENAQVALDSDGVPCHDRATMRCGDSPIFLAGDVANDLPLLHEASHDGAIAGRNAAAYPAEVKTDRHVPFTITFTDPPVVSIGESEADGAVSGCSDYSDQGRARVEARAEGAVTLYAAAPDGVLIGADLVAPAGEHLGHLLAWAIQNEMTATQVLTMPFYHPTIEEGLKQALRTVCAATPIEIPATQDAGSPSGG